jgi:Flp pilus assembly protein TadD
VAGRFFSHPDLAPNISIETGFFRTEKPRGGLRFVVQGGSSAAGFPYGYGASIAGMLEQRLRREFPEKEIEVVTTAMSAVNSYALLDFTDEILAVGPDAVLIYAGHNEYLGILVVGSAFTAAQSPALTRMVMRLRHLRLYRWIEEAISPRQHEGAARSGPLMARVAAKRRIPLGSDLYEAGLEQYRSNLRAILGVYRDAGVPVFLGTLASNEKDQAPFTSEESTQAAAELDEARDLLASGKVAEALSLARRVHEREPGSARAAYVLGQVLAAVGEQQAAAEAWRRARDLDALRFRAPSAFRRIIEELAAEFGATLVDVEGAMRAASPMGSVGSELMLEHLHPNVDGYFLLADAFHDRLVESGLLGDPGQAVADARARREVPLSAAEERFGEYKLARLVNDWPFTEERREPVLPPPEGLEDQLAQALYRKELDWPRVQLQLKQAYRVAGDRAEYLRLSLILADAFPYVTEAQRDAGQALLDVGRATQAYRYFFRGVAYAPGDAAALKGLARAAMEIGLDQEARKALSRVLEADPRDTEARRMLGSLGP